MIIMLNIPAAPAGAPTPAPTSSSSRITKIHIRCPDEYDRKAETAQAWLDSICLYLLINQALYCYAVCVIRSLAVHTQV